MAIPKAVYIREVGPREGLQTLTRPIATEAKLKLIELLSASGVREIEVTSMVRPDRVPQMADAEDLMRRLVKRQDIRYTALYLNQKGFLRAEELGIVQNQGWLYTATSDTFLMKNSRTSREKVVSELDDWISLFAKHGKVLHGVMVSTAFGCALEGKDASYRLLSTCREVLEALSMRGVIPKEVSFADTVGYASPEMVRRQVGEFRCAYPDVLVSLHLHDTRGTGLANAYAGLLEGVTHFDASVGGVGGCPFTPGAAGNIATEDFVYMCHELGIETGIALDAYVAAAQYLSSVLDPPCQAGIATPALSGKYFRSVMKAGV